MKKLWNSPIHSEKEGDWNTDFSVSGVVDHRYRQLIIFVIVVCYDGAGGPRLLGSNRL